MTTNEINRVREFNILQSPARLASALAGNLIQNSALFRFAGSVGRRSGLGRVKEPKALSETELIGLSMGVVRGYVANVELVEALGKAYGFRPVFVWQPDVFSKPRLVAFEAEEKAKVGWASSLFTEVHRQLERADALVSNPGFLNLSGIFLGGRLAPVSGLLPHDRRGERPDRRGAGLQAARKVPRQERDVPTVEDWRPLVAEDGPVTRPLPEPAFTRPTFHRYWTGVW